MSLFAILPLATLMAAWYAARPVAPCPGAWRLAAVRATVVVGAYATVTTELMSDLKVLSHTGACVVWALGLAVAVTAAVIRRRRAPQPRPRQTWSRLTVLEWLTVVGLVALAGGTLLVALVAPPNNFDSQAYHLPKVEEWATNGSVRLFPANFFAQVALAPGAEYLLLHLRLLTGGDSLYTLVQWGAMVLCAVASSWIALTLGARRFGQLAAAFVVVSAPMVVLQASSTQTDLVAAAWAACAGVCAIAAAWKPGGTADVLALGAAVGLACNTKSTSLVAAGLLFALWLVVRASRVRSARSALRLTGVTAAAAVVALVIAGPFLARMTVTYGNPLGPQDVRTHGMERHDPAAVTLNAARLLQTVTEVPDAAVNSYTARGVLRLSKDLHQNIIDPQTTRATSFPVPYAVADEDLSPYPVQVVAACLGLVFCLLWRRRDPRVFSYALTCLLVGVAFAASIKWQWFVNRLMLPGFVVATPLAGVAADALLQRARTASRAVAATGLTLALIVAGTSGVYSILYGRPRPLLGPQSVLTADPMQIRFARIPDYRADYEWAAATLRASGAHRVGMVINYNQFEYPLHVMLPGRVMVNLESDVPGHPAPQPASMDAVVCFSPPPPSCTSHVPPGWRLQYHPAIAVALPPGR